MNRNCLFVLAVLFVGCGESETENRESFTYVRTATDPATFYFDYASGDDENDGLSESTPLKNLWIIEFIPLVSGDTIALKRGSVWTDDRVRIAQSGTETAPIAITDWGSGDAPSLTNKTSEEPAVTIGGSHVTVRNLHIAGTNRAPGILTGESSSHVTIANCEVERSGMGVAFHGSEHLLEDSYIHDLHLVRNTPGGDDDYGANGVFISEADSITVRRNRFFNCMSASHDYGTDGGTVELWKNCSNIRVEYNWSEANNGFMEIGGTDGDQISDVLVHHNVSLNDIAVFVPHFSGNFAASVRGVRYENNTIVVSVNNAGYSLFYSPETDVSAETLSVRNNIFWSNTEGAGRIFAVGVGSSFVHAYNLYNLSAAEIFSGSELLVPDDSELVGADPLFVDAAEGDFSLGDGSPAINGGEDLGYEVDFDQSPIPWSTTAPDIGAYESQE